VSSFDGGWNESAIAIPPLTKVLPWKKKERERERELYVIVSVFIGNPTNQDSSLSKRDRELKRDEQKLRALKMRVCSL